MSDITLHQGDALDIMPTLRARSVDLIVTDPPYMIGAVSSGALASKTGTWGDMMNSSRWFETWYDQCRRLLKQDGAMWTCCNWRSLPVILKAASDTGWGVASVLVWYKGGWIGPGGSVGLRPSYELVALLPMPDFAIPDRGIPDMWTIKASGFKEHHPAEKPEALGTRIVTASGKEGGVILDPFMGSGSLLVGAKAVGCDVVGIDTEARYVAIADQRLQQISLLEDMPA